ncbi:quinone oxidoreductase-like protein 2 isoform X1 [Mytilus edulis]|uniref:quinone oxidoreductase-like protein 2 isoform X1 n=2 Tax=Mytilus edulis TaxID=6550 RepID=UPI0039EED063
MHRLTRLTQVIVSEARRTMFTAAVCTEICKPLEFHQKKDHGLSPFDDEVLLSVKYCGINFADILVCQGKYQSSIPVPFTPGTEVTGIIQEVGKNVKTLKKGDKVVSLIMTGGFSTHCIAPEIFTWKLPSSVDLRAGAGLVVNYGTAYLALTRKANLQQGESVLVTAAAGGTGLAAVEIASKVFKSKHVIAACGGPEKGIIAKSKGATDVIDYKQEKLRNRIKDITGGDGVDVVFDPVGGDMFLDCVKSMAREGRILTIGYASGKIPSIPANLLLLKSGSAMGLFWGEYRIMNTPVFLKSIEDVLEQTRLGNITPHIGKEFPLNKINEAFQYVMGRGSTGKVVISMDRQESNL